MSGQLLLTVAGGSCAAAVSVAARAAAAESGQASVAARSRAHGASGSRRLVPFYEYGEERFFDSDGAPPEVAAARRAGFERLAAALRASARRRRWPASEALEPGISDLQFTRRYRVPSSRALRRAASEGRVARCGVVRRHGHRPRRQRRLRPDGLVRRQRVRLRLLQGVHRRGHRARRDLGPVLGAYHPVVADNVRRLQAISGLDEVSFHMSGTEAVMQAVRLARYHTGRSHLVRFCGAYHGWWDDVQPGVGNPAPVHDDLHAEGHGRRRRCACSTAPRHRLRARQPAAGAASQRRRAGDATLVASDRRAQLRSRAPTPRGCRQLRAVCTKRSIVLIFDEVFVGFRIAYGGAQEYFGVPADMVTYGKTLGGGLPVGVVCGKARS